MIMADRHEVSLTHVLMVRALAVCSYAAGWKSLEGDGV